MTPEANKPRQRDNIRDPYDPIGCDHHWPSGFGSFQFISGGSGPGGREEHVQVCLICGDIQVSGRAESKEGDKEPQRWFNHTFSLYCVDTLASVIRNAAYMNELTADTFLDSLRDEIELQEKRDKILLSNPTISKTYPYKNQES